MNRRRCLAGLVFCLLLWAGAQLAERIPGLSDPKTFQASLREAGPWAPLMGLGLMVLQSLVSPIPYALVVIALGATLGPVQGALVAWLGELIGATLAYLLARAGWQRQEPPEWLSDSRRGFATLLTLRLLPGVSFDLVSYACGAAGVPYRLFLVTTMLGMLPSTLALVMFGQLLWESPRRAAWLLLGLLPLYAAVAWWWVRRNARLK